MTKTRDIADLLDANGDVKLGALDNVPASNDASALTTGTLNASRLPASGVNAASLTTGTLDGARLPNPLPAIDGSNLTGIDPFPSGTLMLFQQTSAPSGWTKQTTHNDKALRVVSGSVGSGGSSAFTTAFGTPTVTGTIAGSTGSHTLSTAEMPSHNHSYTQRAGSSTIRWDTFSNSTSVTSYNSGSTTGSTGGGGSHSHSLSATFSGGSAAINVQYVDLIIASKN